MQSVTFSSTNTTTPSTTPRVITMTADDTAATPTTSDTVTDTVDVTIPAPTVTAGGSAALYTAGANAVTVDNGIKVNSVDTGHMTSATMAITTNLQSGDTLNFSSQNGITETSFSSGTLTLGGTATTAQYQTALQSVTFNSSSTSTATRSITVQVDDSSATPSTSGTAADTVDVYAPATVTALYVKGSAWTTARPISTVTWPPHAGQCEHAHLGLCPANRRRPEQGPPLAEHQRDRSHVQRGGQYQHQLAEADRRQPVGLFDPVGDRLQLAGWQHLCLDLSTSLTKDRLEISFLSTGANAVTDVRGAGLSGNWTNGTSTFSNDGDGLAGTASGPNSGVTSDFNFLFNVLPGDSARNGIAVNSTSYLDVKNKLGNSTASSAYAPYYDVLGVGTINSTSYLDVKDKLGKARRRRRSLLVRRIRGWAA